MAYTKKTDKKKADVQDIDEILLTTKSKFESLDKLTSKIDNLFFIILTLLVLLVIPLLGNAIEVARTDLAIYLLRGSFVERFTPFYKILENEVKNEPSIGKLSILLRTSSKQEIYSTGIQANNNFKRMVVVIESDGSTFDINDTVSVEIYPTDDQLKEKFETIVLQAFTPSLRAVIGDISRQFMKLKIYGSPEMGIFNLNVPAKWFPYLIFAFSLICNILIKTYLNDLAEIRKGWKDKTTEVQDDHFSNLQSLYAPKTFIQRFHLKWWYPFSKKNIILLGILYFIVIIIMGIRVNLSIQVDLFPLPVTYDINNVAELLLSAVLVVWSLIILRSSLNKLVFTANKRIP